MADDAASVHVERRGALLLVTLDRPAVRNAVDRAAAWAIAAAMDRLDDDPGLQVGILQGAGGTFSTGADLKSTDERPLPDRGPFGLCRHPPAKPLIAAVEGWALGGGFEIALACDLVVAARDARFGLPEVRRGVVAAGGGAFRLASRLPPALALEMALTGTPRDAEFCHRHGLVNRLADPGAALAQAIALAEELLEAAPLALAATVELMRAARQPHVDLWGVQDRLLARVRGSADRLEGARAFAERRRPVWSGR